MKAHAFMLICIASIEAAGCSTNSVGIAYKPTRAVVVGLEDAPKISVGSFIDQRGEASNWIGAIRGGFGNPLKNIEVAPSVATVVQMAFTDGVRARALQPPSGPGSYELSGVITKFDCSQYVRREAHVAIAVRVFDTSSRSQVFAQTYSSDGLNGSLGALDVGIFASVESLRALAEQVLNETVDKALDDVALRYAIRKHE